MSATLTPRASVPGDSVPPVADSTKISIWKDSLYEACRDAGSEGHVFSQSDLLNLNIIPGRNAALLLSVVQALSDDRLFVAVNTLYGLAWKWRDEGEAQKYKLCTTDEQAMVYGLIDEAGGDGLWMRYCKKRLNLNDALLNQILEELEQKGLIRPLKSVEHPNKKFYIKASVAPSKRATGGPWYTDQNLDEAFIEEIQRVIFDIVKGQSVYNSAKHGDRPLKPKKGVITGGAAVAAGKKRLADQISDDDDPFAPTVPTASRATLSARPFKPAAQDVLLPRPAGFKGYPTVREIARLLSRTGITGSTILSEDDVQKLVNVLVYDGLVEPIRVAGKLGYRVSRVPRQSVEGRSSGMLGENGAVEEKGMPDPYVSALIETPCGRCPVFDLCEPGGPITPTNCMYFPKWLGLE